MPNTLSSQQVLTRGVAEILPDKDSLVRLMDQGKIRVYLGIDPTGAFLHLGHSVALRKLQQFADLGHEVILLVGNGTVRIGDPTDRDSSRPMLTDEQIEANFKDWQQQASKILDFDKIEIKHNGDWLDKLTYIDMIKLMAQTTVQQLIERDMFQQRMKKGLPIYGHEIIYPLLQGYDSVVMDVDLEIGGTDQTFNMMMGRTLQKHFNNKEKWVLTTPIIDGTDGRKMSKSFNNYVALTDAPKEMYGKLMSIKDDLIINYFTVLTDVADDEIAAMKQAMDQGENPMKFKKKLALTITQQYHHKDEAKAAQTHFETAFQEGKVPDKLPKVKVDQSSLTILELLQLCMPDESNSQLRRLIEQQAVELLPQEERPTDPNQSVNPTDIKVVKVGKRRWFSLET